MLTLYKRHLKTCCHGGNRFFRRCKCPVWIEGVHDGRYRRHSLKTGSWERAEVKKREIEDFKPEALTFDSALQKFIDDCHSRRLSRATISKYCTLNKRLLGFAVKRGIRFVRNFEIQDCYAFRATFRQAPGTQAKHLERLRTFFRFCQNLGAIEKNPASFVRPPKVPCNPTLPFSDEEVGRILNNVSNARLRAFVDVLRFSGLRIGDAALLRKEKIQNGKLFLYTAKTGTPVWIPLPPSLLQELLFLPTRNGYYFLRGASLQVHTVADLWRRDLNKVFKKAGIANGHPHRFRDTFAVNLLLKGVPIEQVSVLLGHSSVRVTEKHYAPWTKSRQDQLEMSVGRLWDRPEAPTATVPSSVSIQ